MLIRHDIDRLGWASSASNESASLKLIQTLHVLVGATICGAQTNAVTQLERVARCNRCFHAGIHTPHGRARVKVAVSRAAQRSVLRGWAGLRRHRRPAVQ